MGLFVVSTLCFLFFGISTCHMTFLDEEKELLAAQEKAQYHLEELQKSIARISSLQKRSFRTKRDLESAQSKRKADFLFSSLVNFCHQIQGFDKNNPNITTRIVSSTPSPGEKQVVEPENKNWIEPAVRPTRVQAVRLDKNSVGIQFYINESTPSVITRIAGLDIEKLEVPKGHGSRDHGGFKIDTSTYCKYEYNEIDNQFIFQAKENPDDSVILRVNLCKFDKFQDQSVPWENRTWETRYGPRREDIKLPKIRINSNITNEIILIPGKNISFEMIVHMDQRSHTFVYAVLYDRKTKNMISSTFSYNIDQENYAIPRKSDEREILLVDFLQSSVVKNASEHKEGSRDDGVIKEIRSRVTLITDTGHLTGKLYVSSADRFGTYYEPNIVSAVYVGHEIKIRKPSKQNVFPRRKALLQKQEKFLCDHEGNKRHEKVGKNCTLACGAIGRDLNSLTISKKGADVPIYRSMNQKWTDRLFTSIDVGTASPDIEGTYLCTVTGARGKYKETQEMQLFTSGFPKIDVNETTVLDLGNDTSQIKCVVYGRLPITVGIEMTVEDSSFSLTDRNNSLQRDMDDDNGTVFTIDIPTEDLRYPARTLQFRVHSEFGNDYHFIYLDEIIPDHRGAAKMVPEESALVNFGNGTTAITCTAIGRSPLSVWMTIGGTREDNRIDNEPEFLRVETKTEKGKSVTLFANTRSLIRNYSQLYCIARNNYGFDDTNFYLRDYIDWNLRYQQ